MKEIKISIGSCARCGEDHSDLVFKPFTHPIETHTRVLFTHFAPCPTNGEPIVMEIS